MVAFTAIIDFSYFIVFVMPENSRGTLLFCKTNVVDHLHVFL
jgi:hypothetical protein